jgi:hypothetical protein
MTYQNDPNRRDGRRFGYTRKAEGGMNWLPLALGLVAVVALFLLLMPGNDTVGPRTTENAPNVTKPVTPTTPPSNNPAPAPSPGPAK